MENQDLSTTIYNFIPNLIKSLLVFLLFYCVASFIYNYFSKETVSTYEEQLKREKIKLSVYQIKDFVFYTIIVIGSLIAIKQLGFETTTFLTILATLGIAFGIAAQGTISSAMAGLFLITSSIYSIGDEITIVTPISKQYYKGIVVSFNLFYTTLYTKEGQFLIIPNSIVQTNIISNDKI